MIDSLSNKGFKRQIKVDDWIFEIKTLRALRVEEFGKPYSAVATITLNGDTAFIDSLLAREQEEFSKQDYQAFVKISQQLSIETVSFDRFKGRIRSQQMIKVPPIVEQPQLKLVKS